MYQLVYQLVYRLVYQLVYRLVYQLVYRLVYQLVYRLVYRVIYHPVYQVMYHPVYQVTYQNTSRNVDVPELGSSRYIKTQSPTDRHQSMQPSSSNSLTSLSCSPYRPPTSADQINTFDGMSDCRPRVFYSKIGFI